MKVKLYCIDSKKNIRVWKVKSYKNGLTTSSGVLHGFLTEVDHPIHYGAANRTKKEQIALKARSMINRKLDGGYCYTKKDAIAFGRTNTLGFTRPMAAFRYDKLKKADLQKMFKHGVYVQRKYNGHRCLITNDNGVLIAYSRGGKPIPAIAHILMNINIEDIPVGTTIDGELYRHGWSLQKISSAAKRKKPNEKTLELKLIVYDIMLDKSYGARYRALGKIRLGAGCQLASTAFLKGRFNPMPILKAYLLEGYEGVILRCDFGGYEGGKRPKWLIKLKLVLDDEFMVKRIISSKEGLAILVCIAENGKEFRVFASGNHAKKRRELENKKDYIGRYIKVNYFERSEDGLPVPSVAKEWRNKRHE